MFDYLMKFKLSKKILTNFDKFVPFTKIKAEGSCWKNLKKFQEITKGIIINCGEYSEKVRVTILNHLMGQILKKEKKSEIL